MPARIISPETAFTATLKAAARAESQGKATITKTEAEKALRQLDGPQTKPADRARIVKDFLDSKGATALSPKAKDVLLDFVKQSADPRTGADATQVKAAAREEASQAERNLAKAQDRLEKLINGGTSAEKKAGLQQVRAWLDAAEADVMQAKDQLKKIAGNAAAKTANKELTAAQKEIGKAADDVTRLIGSAKGGTIKKADLEAVRKWLAEPLPELNNAANALGFERQTRKFPSDNEDGGGNTGGSNGATTAKHPSDLEDGGFNGGGPGGGAPITTEKAPSDNEDGGGGGVVTTAKFPSDNEDGGGANPGGGGGVMHTMKFPSDNEDGGGGTIEGVKPKKGDVKPARAEQMKKAFDKVDRAGTLNWNQGGVIESHLGVRFARVELKRDNHPDGYTYTAFIPLGALTPTATARDPNKVNEFYVERTGGLAGLTTSVGPLHLT